MLFYLFFQQAECDIRGKITPTYARFLALSLKNTLKFLLGDIVVVLEVKHGLLIKIFWIRVRDRNCGVLVFLKRNCRDTLAENPISS